MESLCLLGSVVGSQQLDLLVVLVNQRTPESNRSVFGKLAVAETSLVVPVDAFRVGLVEPTG